LHCASDRLRRLVAQTTERARFPQRRLICVNVGAAPMELCKFATLAARRRRSGVGSRRIAAQWGMKVL
jgi:hypothetical protein